jgi:hypothetical protein
MYDDDTVSNRSKSDILLDVLAEVRADLASGAASATDEGGGHFAISPWRRLPEVGITADAITFHLDRTGRTVVVRAAVASSRVADAIRDIWAEVNPDLSELAALAAKLRKGGPIGGVA